MATSTNNRNCGVLVNEEKSQNACYTIRNARPEDCGTILQYIKDLAVHEKEKESIVEVTEKDLVADGFGESPSFKCLVAEEESDGKGIGKELVKCLSKIALDNGLGKIRWLVLNFNEIAVDFYKRIDVIIEEDWELCTLTPVAMEKLLNQER